MQNKEKENNSSGGVWLASGGDNPATSGEGVATGSAEAPHSPNNGSLEYSNAACPTASGQSVGGPVRRACPASGAQWNVQVVRGKMTGRCLWNACKALSLGLLLMILGAAMATIGYYADQLSVAQVVRGNHTVRVKNESRGFHLNNLSYAGPMVMGVGGFIVVAACVMTFEARDSAAKVVPARFKSMAASGCLSHQRPGASTTTATVGSGLGSSRRSAASQTQSGLVGGGALGVAASTATSTGIGDPGGGGGGGVGVSSSGSQVSSVLAGAAGVVASAAAAPSPVQEAIAAGAAHHLSHEHGRHQHQNSVNSASSPTDRKTVTAAFQQFSKELDVVRSPTRQPIQRQLSIPKTTLSRSPSAPLLCPIDNHGNAITHVGGIMSPPVAGSPRPHHGFPRSHYQCHHQHHHHNHHHKHHHQHGINELGPIPGIGYRSGKYGAYSLLSPAGLLKRHAVSVDESAPYRCSKESLHGSQTSMAMDLHIPNEGPVTLRVRDTARRHMLQRQRPIDVEDEMHHLMQGTITTISSATVMPPMGFTSTSLRLHGRRRSSNASDHVRHGRKRRRDTAGPFLERAASTDARVACASSEAYQQLMTPSLLQQPVVCCKERVATSQDTVHYRQHGGSGETAPCQASHRHHKHHKNNCEFRKQRSYSPKSSCKEIVTIEPVNKELVCGNRSN